MNQEIKAKWIAALRSGEYKQGRGHLKGAQDDFCCLGVLCDLYATEVGGYWAIRDSVAGEKEPYHTFMMNDRSQEVADFLLPVPVTKWAGLEQRDPSVDVPKSVHPTTVSSPNYSSSLSLVNDAGQDFSYIADIIEKQL
jgi:hypothetical protein